MASIGERPPPVTPGPSVSPWVPNTQSGMFEYSRFGGMGELKLGNKGGIGNGVHNGRS